MRYQEDLQACQYNRFSGVHLTAFQLQGYTKSRREATTLVDGGDPPSGPGSVLAALSSKVSSSEKLTRSKPGHFTDTVKLSIRSKIASFIRAVLSSDRSGVLGTARHRSGEQCGFRDDHLDVAGWFGSIRMVVGITNWHCYSWHAPPMLWNYS
jgi:hypothetical protein